MRFTYPIVVVLALAGLVPAFAANHDVKETSYHYDACTCHFGYGASCQIAVACIASGGKCGSTCVPPRQSE
jgi:hypothetical protein